MNTPVTITTEVERKIYTRDVSVRECLDILRDVDVTYKYPIIKSSEENYRTIVYEYPVALTYIDNPSNYICLIAMQQDINAIDYVQNIDEFIDYLLVLYAQRSYHDEVLFPIGFTCCQRKIEILEDILSVLQLQNIENNNITSEISFITNQIEKYTQLASNFSDIG